MAKSRKKKLSDLPRHFGIPDPRNVTLLCTVADAAPGGPVEKLRAWLGEKRIVLVADDESGKPGGFIVYDILGRETIWEDIVAFLKGLTWTYPEDVRADEIFYQTSKDVERGPRVWTAVPSKAMSRRG